MKLEKAMQASYLGIRLVYPDYKNKGSTQENDYHLTTLQ